MSRREKKMGGKEMYIRKEESEKRRRGMKEKM